MRNLHLMFLAISSLCLEQAVAQKVGFSSDEITIYQEFLFNYQPMGYLINMQLTTGDFPRMTGASAPLLVPFNLPIPTQSARKFPAELMEEESRGYAHSD